MKILCSIFSTSLFFVFLATCCAATAAEKEVVIYTALDQIFSEPILKEFEKRYGIRVKAVYDIEAVKTVGLVNRLIAEKSNPRCDVFWNNEILRTLALKRKGILAPYLSAAAATIPDQYKDKHGFWTGFAARARVLVVNTELVKEEDYPTSIMELTSPRWRGRFAMALPLFGTTSTHVAAMFAAWGPEKARDYLGALLANDARIVDGNSVVRDMTGSGEVLFGITDTDDANVGIRSGMSIRMIAPDQDGGGTLLIPNTVALIKGAPHPRAARLLIDYLLSGEVEEKLAHANSAQIPLRPGVQIPEGQLSKDDLVAMNIDYERMADMLDQSITSCQQLFMR